MNTAARIQTLSKLLNNSNRHSLIIQDLVNIRYLTGFSGSAALLVVRPARNQGALGLLCSDGRYREQAEKQLDQSQSNVELFIGSPSEQMSKAAEFASSEDSVAIEADTTSVAMFDRWAELLKSPPLRSTIKVQSLRRFKDDAEVRVISKACGIADEALSNTLAKLADEPTEMEFAAELEFKMKMLGADGPSFETIVASGPNSAMPHARPTQRRIRESDVVVVDFGAMVDGYHSDCTRSYWIGDSPSERYLEIYHAVEQAQIKGILQTRLGEPVSEIDAACRNSLALSSLDQYFTHSTGHGVGLEVHELPWVSSASDSGKLSLGDVVTVEPGVYLPEEFGVRIEDTLAVGSGDTTILTNSAKSPLFAG